jgi:DNA helicase-2/ATP-dependent DNA helicase PcrA
MNQIILEKNGQKIRRTNGVFNKVTLLLEQIHKGPATSHKQDHSRFTYSTIHSVKGESHRSVLLIDSENDKNPKVHTNMLKSLYCQNEIDFAKYWVQKNLLYVAMSRPTQLFTFAMDDCYITQEEIEMFKKQEWTIEYVD